MLEDLERDDAERCACVKRMERCLEAIGKETAPSKQRADRFEGWLKALRRCVILQKGLGHIKIDCTSFDADGRLCREVEYEYSKKLQGIGARRYAKGGLLSDGAVALSAAGGKRKKLVFSTLQGFLSDGRALLVGKTAFDVDCENGDPRLIVSLAEQTGHSRLIPSIIYYVQHRGRCLEAIKQRHGVEKNIAKRLPNTLCYGGSYKTWRDTFELPEAENTLTGVLDEAMAKVLNIGNELREFMKKMFVHERFKKLVDAERPRIRREKTNVDASLTSLIIQTCENMVLGIIDKALFDLGWDVLALIFDGLLAEPTTHSGWIAERGSPASLEDALAKAQSACEAKGWKVVLAEKPLHGKYQTADDPLPTIMNARRAMADFEALEGAGAVDDEGEHELCGQSQQQRAGRGIKRARRPSTASAGSSSGGLRLPAELQRRLAADDAGGWTSANVVLIDDDRQRALLVREERSGTTLLSFLGGKGAGDETPQQAAAREVREETRGLLSEATMRVVEQTPAAAVAYHPNSKAVLFVHRLRGLSLSDVSAPERWRPVPATPTLRGIEWVPLADLRSAEWQRANLHPFVPSQIRANGPGAFTDAKDSAEPMEVEDGGGGAEGAAAAEPSTEMIKAVERAARTVLDGPHDSCTVEELRQMLPVEMSASNELVPCLRWMDRTTSVLLFRDGEIHFL